MTDEPKSNKKILIVEDDMSLRNAMRDKFTREGFVVIEAKNGEEGLEVALRDHPDLILLDILMPIMDGIMMMKKLRQENEWGKNVAIIILTNVSPDDEKINQAITDNEPAYYLVKSNYSITELSEKIRERLNRS